MLTIGNVLRTLDDFNNALEILNKCLAIRENVFDKEHPHTANSYNNIGMYGMAYSYFSLESKKVQFFKMNYKGLTLVFSGIIPYHT